MKTIGLIGGLSWYSTLDYYRYINQGVNERLGGDEAAELILYSVNFGEIKRLTVEGNWKDIAAIMIDAAKKIETAGAECVLLGANTMHHIAGEVAAAVRIPLLHIADAAAAAINQQKIRTVALLGTKYTMQFDFYRQKLTVHGITTIIPGPEDAEYINNSIYRELGKGIFREETLKRYQGIIARLIEQGAEGVILGCTEIPLLIQQADCPIPVFDTTKLHAAAAVEFSTG